MIVLYTVVPLQKIYDKEKDPNQALNKKQDEKAEYKEFRIQHGHIIAIRKDDEYIVDRILSTDMSDYLNQDCAPGKSYRHKK